MKKLLLCVLLLMTMTPLFLSNSASAKAIDPSSTPSLIRGRPDLKVSITSLDQNICSSYASGSRWIIVNYTVTNIGMYTSSEYYAAVFIDGNFWAGGGATPNSIPIMVTQGGGLGGVALGGKRVITVEVTPLNPNPGGLSWRDAMAYANRSLDGNASNNTITQTMYVNPCP